MGHVADNDNRLYSNVFALNYVYLNDLIEKESHVRIQRSRVGPAFCALQKASFLFPHASVVNVTTSFDNIAYLAVLARLFPKAVRAILVGTLLGTLIMRKNARWGENAKILKNFFSTSKVD